MFEIYGFAASILIGVSLGLIGSGGSILTVPVLVYLFGVNPVAATSYSLFIVGSTAALGSVGYFRKGLVNVKTAIVFGIPSIIAVFITRAYIVPAIPNDVATFNSFVVTKGILLMLLFALLMIAASYSMIRKKGCEENKEEKDQKFNYPLILIEGLLVGVVTGLVGAGGGFLIIPALVFLSKLPMKEAIGTSLIIIAAKSLLGFFGESSETIIDWQLISSVTLFAAVGIFIGMYISKKVNAAKLKPIFGWFVLLMGIYIILNEVFISNRKQNVNQQEQAIENQPNN